MRPPADPIAEFFHISSGNKGVDPPPFVRRTGLRQFFMTIGSIKNLPIPIENMRLLFHFMSDMNSSIRERAVLRFSRDTA